MTIDDQVAAIAKAQADAAVAAHVAKYHSGSVPPVVVPPIVTPPVSGVPAGLKLVYEELFNDAGGLTRGDFYFRGSTEAPRPNEAQTRDASLCTITGGALHVRTQLRNGKWFGGEVNWNRTFNPGYTEVIYTGPPVKKPSWWIGPWLVLPRNPYRPEIDMGEDPNIEDDGIGYLTVHTVGYDSISRSIKAQRGVQHAVGCDWRTGHCVVNVDGVVKATEDNAGALATLTQPMILVIQANVLKPGIWGPPYDGSWTDEEIVIASVRHYE